MYMHFILVYICVFTLRFSLPVPIFFSRPFTKRNLILHVSEYLLPTAGFKINRLFYLLPVSTEVKSLFSAVHQNNTRKILKQT